MLTAKEIDSLPIGSYPNHVLRNKFGKKHGSPVRFQDEKGNVHTFICNRWWRRFRDANPIVAGRAKYNNIETEFKNRYGTKTKLEGNWLAKFFEKWFGWFNKMF